MTARYNLSKDKKNYHCTLICDVYKYMLIFCKQSVINVPKRLRGWGYLRFNYWYVFPKMR